MSIFLSTLNQMSVLFILLLVGFILGRLRAVPDGAAKVLARLETTVLVPALVMGNFFNNFTVANLRVAGKFFLCSCAVLAVVVPLSFALCRLTSRDDFIRKISVYGYAFPNFGFVGNFIAAAIFPDLFFSYIIFSMPLWILIFVWGVPSLLIPTEQDVTLRTRLKNLCNPMFIAMLCGMAVGILSLPLPQGVTSAVSLLGDCMSPVAMLLTGLVLASVPLRWALSDRSVYIASTLRLLVLPLAFLGIFYLLDLPRDLTICAICTLSMPLGLNSVVIPSAYGKNSAVAAGMALVSHLCAIGTIPLIFFLLTKLFGA